MTFSRLIAALLLLAAGAVHAHPGHGAAQAWHWHATDIFGFLLVGALAALAIWFSGRK